MTYFRVPEPRDADEACWLCDVPAGVACLLICPQVGGGCACGCSEKSHVEGICENSLYDDDPCRSCGPGPVAQGLFEFGWFLLKLGDEFGPTQMEG